MFNLEKLYAEGIACNYVLINIITSNNSAYSRARQKLKTTVTGDWLKFYFKFHKIN